MGELEAWLQQSEQDKMDHSQESTQVHDQHQEAKVKWAELHDTMLAAAECLSNDAVLRPPSDEKEASAFVQTPVKDNKRKRLTSEDPKPKTKTAHKPRKNTIPLTEESVRHLMDEDEEEEDDGSVLVDRMKKTIDASKAAGSRMAASVHREACSRSRVELRRYEADLRRVTEERNTLRLLFGQKEEEIKDIRAELAKDHQDQTDLTEHVIIILKTHGLDPGTVANILISQLRQKLEVIGKLREEVDMIRAESLGWKDGMDRLATEKETARAQLSSAKNQLQVMKEKSSVQARKIVELEARLASELAKAKSDAEKAKANADAFVAVYQADAKAALVQAREAVETANTRAHWVAELAKCHSQRETLEEIHARGFDLTEEIKRAKALEANAEALVSNDDDDGSKSGSESGVEPDGEETAPGDN
ncbi:uncharacterized protein [Nicotiana tomentosiformis]|uniref:uncharacterized protein n=1 Tax=Nicotiana tomentosiformis TaxID=4098 RepID=UPI00388CAF91